MGNIVSSNINDLKVIFSLYDAAIEYQKTKFEKHWKGFDESLVRQEIHETRQWKIVDDDGNIQCIFAIAFNDPFIWGEKDKDSAMYIHRIVTHPDHHGNNFVLQIIAWAKLFAQQNNILFIRMDTWGDNKKLIDYYIKCGFDFLGLITPEASTQLPKHYSAIHLSLFEIKVN